MQLTQEQEALRAYMRQHDQKIREIGTLYRSGQITEIEAYRQLADEGRAYSEQSAVLREAAYS